MRACLSENTYICCIEAERELRETERGLIGRLCPIPGGRDIGHVVLRAGDETSVDQHYAGHTITVPRGDFQRLYDVMTRSITVDTGEKTIVVRKSYNI